MIEKKDLTAFEGGSVLHCKMCIEEIPADTAPRDYARLSFRAFHKEDHPGIFFQLWCDRHECNVTTIEVATDQWFHDDSLPLAVERF
jgi:hypothetical protein